MDDFWIGDFVLVKSLQCYGKFHGTNEEGKAVVKVNQKLLIVDSHDLVLSEEPPSSETLFQDKKSPKIRTKKSMDAAKEIDLHLDKLDPRGQIDHARMLDFQINACEDFLEKATQSRYRTVLIIHGKGSGILKAEVQNLLNAHPKVEHIFEKNKGGASEVWLKI